MPWVLIHASARDATGFCEMGVLHFSVLIHASARDATAKSYKIGNNFTVLFRKFVQKFDIVTFYISIFQKSKNNIFCFCSANLPGFLRCFRFAPTFSYIVCQNLKSLYFSVENFLVVHTLYSWVMILTSMFYTDHGVLSFLKKSVVCGIAFFISGDNI